MSNYSTPPEVYYKTPHKIDWVDFHKRNVDLGEQGQELVMGLEKKYLEAVNREELANSVCVQDDWSGCDVRSFFADGGEKFIEVKTTKKGVDAPYFLSRNELLFLSNNRGKAFIYRVSIGEDGAPPRLKVYTFSEVIHADITPHKFSVKH